MTRAVCQPADRLASLDVRRTWPRKALLLVGGALLLSGCSFEPSYTRPDAPVSSTFSAGSDEQGSSDPSPAAIDPTTHWQQFIQDPRLSRLIATAIRSNRDFRVAALNVQRARALYGIQRSELLPTVNANAGMSQQRVPADLSATGNAVTSEQYGVNLGLASWEVDFFGRLRSLEKQALEEFLASEQAHRSSQILLVAEVARAYLTLAADQENLELARTTLESQEQAFELIRRRFVLGLATELDAHRANTQVQAARSALARYGQLVAQDRQALNLLVGGSVDPQDMPLELGPISRFHEIPAGLSSQVLLARPDIVQAEHRLRAAYANVGAARSAFFPRISLTAAFGTASSDLSGLFRAGSAAWSYSPQIVMPIFDPRTWQAEEVSQIEKEIAVAQYEKAIQSGFREVADALTVHAHVQQQLTAQQALVESLEQTYRLSSLRYDKGVDNYLSVLDSQRSLFAARQELVAVRLSQLANQIQLYAALGGGWQASEIDETSHADLSRAEP